MAIEILLTDPKVTYVGTKADILTSSSHRLMLKQETHLCPPLEAVESLPEDPKLWNGSISSISDKSLLECIISAYKDDTSEVGCDPISCTYKSRRMALSYFIGYFRQRYLNLVRGARPSRVHWLHKEDWTSISRTEVIQSLIYARSELQQIELEVKNTVHSLRIDLSSIEGSSSR